MDHNGDFVEVSGIKYHFGGEYTYESTLLVDEEILYISVVPKHWGHFLIDCISRLWCLQQYPDIKIAYCAWGFSDSGVDGNFLECLKLAGINGDQLIYVKKPMHFKKVIIPSRTFTSHYSNENNNNYSVEYKNIVDTIIRNYEKKERNFKAYEKIYLTRLSLNKAKYMDVGEEDLKEFFVKNGFHVVSPENMSFDEQMFYFRNAKVIACMSGTLAHNSIFSGLETDWIILNRTGITNVVQVRIDELFDRTNTYIDVYHVGTENADYGLGPFWVEITQNIIDFAKDQDYEIPNRNQFTNMKNYLRFHILKSMRSQQIIKIYQFIKTHY